MRGIFVVFEGLDRSGKTTQSKRLVETLRGRGLPVKHINFPMRETTIGSLVNSYLKSDSHLSDEAIHLLFSANRWEFSSALMSDLNEGTYVICDRYAFSGVAYTAAKGLDFNWCKSPDIGLPKPDKVFYLDVNTTTAKGRADFGDERYEKAEFQQKVGEQFKKFSEDEFWQNIDASESIESIGKIIEKEVETVESRQRGAIGKLWVSE